MSGGSIIELTGQKYCHMLYKNLCMHLFPVAERWGVCLIYEY
jgi:hypothetical protein